MFGLSLDGGEKLCAAGIHRAREHEILPNQQPFFVAKIIEVFHFIDSAAPNADHVHLGLHRARQQMVIVGAADFTDKTVRRDPVRALGKNRASVDRELKGFSELIRMTVERDCSQTDASVPAIQDLVSLREFEPHIVEGLSAVAVRPPQLGF